MSTPDDLRMIGGAAMVDGSPTSLYVHEVVNRAASEIERLTTENAALREQLVIEQERRDDAYKTIEALAP